MEKASKLVKKFGHLPLNQGQFNSKLVYQYLHDIGIESIGKEITLRARLNKVRSTSKRCFLELRQQDHSIQGLVEQDESFVKFCSSVKPESLVFIKGKIQSAYQPIKSCSISNLELSIDSLFVERAVTLKLPILPNDQSKLDTRLDNRVLDLRSPLNQSIFKIQSLFCKEFRQFLNQQGFTEIHTPKLTSSSSEGGSNVFQVSYFKKNAFLAQSPQLYKQMMICADFERVYEIGPVFRAENSFTHRHLTEFTGLDLEMTIKENYHEVLDLFDSLFISIFKTLKNSPELNQFKKYNTQFQEFEFLDPSLRLEYPEAVKLLRQDGLEIGDFEDFNIQTEKRLGRIVKEKYKTDFFILDKFPLNLRPFYTMPNLNSPNYSNSYDFFIRGEEILSGAQRIHDPQLLTQKATEHGINIKTIQAYLDAFQYACPPHAGGGIGLERAVMLYLNIPNIRETTLFPRDPHRLEP